MGYSHQLVACANPDYSIGRAHPQPQAFRINPASVEAQIPRKLLFCLARQENFKASSQAIGLESTAKMVSSDSAYIDEDVYTREFTDPDGIVQATKRERVLGWHSFLDLVWRACVPIIAPSELEGGDACESIGRGATMVVWERVWKTTQPRAGGGARQQPAVVAVKRLIVRFADSDRPQHELALLANFTLELRALCHSALRSHANIV